MSSRATLRSSIFRSPARSLPALALLGALGAPALVPSPASACAPLPPGLESSKPGGSGSSLPANAAILLFGFPLSLDAITVTVDDAPATLQEVELADGFADLAVRIDPQPMPGQWVVLDGNFCPDSECEPSTLSFSVTEPDTAAPAPTVADAFFAVYDHVDFVSSGGDCQSDSDLTFYVHVPGVAPGTSDAATIVSASWDPDGEGPAGFRRTRLASDDPTLLTISVTAAELGGADPAELCLTITTTDAAGNSAAPFELCNACYLREDSEVHDVGTPPEPTWTDAEAVPGSACAAGVETGGVETGGVDTEPTDSGASDTSGEDDGDKGCACDTRPRGHDLGPWLGVALALGLVRRRSRT